jgi:hypothetical protein
MLLDQMSALKCFRTNELFNINTNSFFTKKKDKDPLIPGDDSDDDEDELAAILREGAALHNPKEKMENVKIEAGQYDSSKPIEQNIKNLRAMI